jgi:hypothetical protein
MFKISSLSSDDENAHTFACYLFAKLLLLNHPPEEDTRKRKHETINK